MNKTRRLKNRASVDNHPKSSYTSTIACASFSLSLSLSPSLAIFVPERIYYRAEAAHHTKVVVASRQVPASSRTLIFNLERIFYGRRFLYTGSSTRASKRGIFSRNKAKAVDRWVEGSPYVPSRRHNLPPGVQRYCIIIY